MKDAIKDDISDLLPALVALRHELHAHPELAFAEHRTAGIVAVALREPVPWTQSRQARSN